MRLTSLWKPVWVIIVVLAAAVYGVMVIREITRRTQVGIERRTRAEAGRAFVEDEAMLGAIWAHQHHPRDASWCPDYSPSFQKGCAATTAARNVSPD